MSMFPNNIRILVVNWLVFLSNKPSANRRSTEGFQAPNFLGPVEEQELRRAINSHHVTFFVATKKIGNMWKEPGISQFLLVF